MRLFFWVTDLLIPASMVLFAVVFLKRPPKKINAFYGYRTKRSMASKEAWDFAHKLCGKAWLWIGLFLLALIAAGKVFLEIPPEYLSLVNLSVTVIAMTAPIPFVEKRLKDRFGK